MDFQVSLWDLNRNVGARDLQVHVRWKHRHTRPEVREILACDVVCCEEIEDRDTDEGHEEYPINVAKPTLDNEQ